MRIEPRGVLELVGDEESIDRAAAIIGGRLLRQSGVFLIAGFGEVGRKVHQILRDTGEELRVIERKAAPDVDVVGDVLDSSLLTRAGLADARGIVLALDSDDATLFATVIARDCAPDVAIVARVNHARNLANIHRAGADFALSISDISGEMLSARLLGRTARVREEHRRVQPIPAARWAGKTMAQLPLRENGCSAVAIEATGDRPQATGGRTMITRIAADTMIDATDVLWVCGTTDALHRLA
jgi:Trk K+ transport system NAD-binding subunit